MKRWRDASLRDYSVKKASLLFLRSRVSPDSNGDVFRSPRDLMELFSAAALGLL
jgi:hypothetical protein